jgi:hypothetical protein
VPQQLPQLYPQTVRPIPNIQNRCQRKNSARWWRIKPGLVDSSGCAETRSTSNRNWTKMRTFVDMIGKLRKPSDFRSSLMFFSNGNR